ncbi:concanavalin A-like lectin/glucanase domain-containing protein, partial [Schizophyllum fasciatum]
AINQGLAYVTDDGNAVIKVDDQTHIPGGWDFTNRQSVRITTTDTYPLNGLIIIDLVHIPYGCSVWPSFWSFGPSAGEWPAGGEIDIIEGVNLVFNEAGGGVFALQMAQSGFYMWFWSVRDAVAQRNDIPHSISGANSQSTMDTTKDWGRPSASFPASGCNDSLWQFFAPQQLVLDITLCGNWAGLPAVYGATCTNQYACLTDNVVGDGANYADAYFEIRTRAFIDSFAHLYTADLGVVLEDQYRWNVIVL